MKTLSQLLGLLALALLAASATWVALPESRAQSSGVRRYLERTFPRTRDLFEHLAEHEPDLLDELDARTRAANSASRAEILSFVEQHHAELGALLRELCAEDAAECDAALLDVASEVRRLHRLRLTRSEERYAAALEAWEIDSRLRLLTARMTLVGEDEALMDEVRQLVEREIALRRAEAEFQLERHRTSAAEIEEQLATPVEDQVQRRMRKIQRTSQRNR